MAIFVRHGVIVLGASLGYDMIEKEARNTKLAVIISYQTSTSGITVLLKNENKNKNKTPPKNYSSHSLVQALGPK